MASSVSLATMKKAVWRVMLPPLSAWRPLAMLMRKTGGRADGISASGLSKHVRH